MRTNWILGCLLSFSAVGCTMPSLSSSGPQFAGQPQAAQLAAMSQGGASSRQDVSWTQKMTNVLTGKSNQSAKSNQSETVSELDPISLSYQSGPPNADLYFSMAKLSDQGGNAEHARSMYHRALTMQPNNLEGMLSLARLEDREGQLDAALHYYKQAAHIHPRSAKALNDLGLCYARRNQLNEALLPLQQAIQLQPTKQLYRNNIAKVLVEVSNINGALQHLSAVHPPAAAQYNLGYLLHQRGRDAEAVQYLTAATQADPNLAAATALLQQLGGNAPRVAQAAPVSNDHVLPTRQSGSPAPYPSTGVISNMPHYQSVPAETAQRPVGYGPAMLPPVRQ